MLISQMNVEQLRAECAKVAADLFGEQSEEVHLYKSFYVPAEHVDSMREAFRKEYVNLSRMYQQQQMEDNYGWDE